MCYGDVLDTHEYISPASGEVWHTRCNTEHNRRCKEKRCRYCDTDLKGRTDLENLTDCGECGQTYSGFPCVENPLNV